MRKLALLLPLLLVNPYQAGGTTESQALPPHSLRIRLFTEHPISKLTLRSPSLLVNDVKMAPEVTFGVVGSHVILLSPKKERKSFSVIRIQTTDADPVTVKLKDGERRYTGTLEIRASHGVLKIINSVDLEDYVLGIVEPELGSLGVEPESLKAQLITSRSYAFVMQGRHKHEGYDFCDSPHCQTYTGYPEKAEFRALAAGLRGIVVTYHSKPIPAFYHDTCGGQTADAEDVWHIGKRPYLRSIKDGSPDAYCRFSPRASWHLNISRETMKKCMVKRGWMHKADTVNALKVTRKDHTGRVNQILLSSNGSKWIPGNTFRNAVNSYYGKEVLPSTYFAIESSGEDFHITGHGWGHGVGLCQTGTIEMARRGKTYQQILAHYFPGTGIAHIDESAVVKAALAPSDLGE